MSTKSLISFKNGNSRLLSKHASGRQVLGAYGTSSRSVLDVREDSSTGVTTQLSSEVEFGKKSSIIGWREWAELPELNVPLIKIKVDTGAKTSALHAYDIKIIKREGKEFAEFVIHPIQNNDKLSIPCQAEIVGMKTVKSSNGYKQTRPVVHTKIKVGTYCWNIDITLTNRDIMNHRMLLGRTAMINLLVDPSKSYRQGFISKEQAKNIYLQKNKSLSS